MEHFIVNFADFFNRNHTITSAFLPIITVVVNNTLLSFRVQAMDLFHKSNITEKFLHRFAPQNNRWDFYNIYYGKCNRLT